MTTRISHIDAKNVNPCVLRQKLELDEVYGAKWHHVAGVDNPGDDALSRLATFKETPKLLDAERYDSIPEKAKHEICAINNTSRETNEDFPLDMAAIANAQSTNEYIKRCLKNERFKTQCRTTIVDNIEVITIQGKVWVPKVHQKILVDWYHINLQHPGVGRMIKSLGTTFSWYNFCIPRGR